MSNTNYPGAIDSPYDPTTTDTLATANHHTLHGLVNDAIVAAETKLGIGSSNQTPAANQLLLGNGAGTTAWGPITPAYATGSTTGTGNFALSASPTFTGTLVAAALGVSGNATVGGTLGVTGVSTFTAVPVLPAGTITLASVSSSTSQSGLGSLVILTGLTSTVTIPAGGRTVRIELFVPSITNSANGYVQLALYNSATVTGSAVQTATMPVGSIGAAFYMFYEYTPSPGSTSWCAAIQFSAGGTSGATSLSSTSLAFLTIKAV
jgi:hypothetical protein